VNFSDESLSVDLDENGDDNSFLSSWPLKDQKLKRIMTQALRRISTLESSSDRVRITDGIGLP